MRHISTVVVNNSWEYPVSGPRAVTGKSVQQSKAGGERVPDFACGVPCVCPTFANHILPVPVAMQVTTEQLSVVGVGTSQKGVRVFRKFLERPHGDVK